MPSRWNELHALADRLRAAALGDRGRETRHAEELDDPARDPRLLLQPRRRLHRALGDPHLGAFLRQRPRPGDVPAADPRRLHRRLADALRLARPGAALDQRLRRGQPRERAGCQQSPARRRRRRGLRRHHVAARRRGRHRAQGLGRRALLQPRLLALHDRAGRDPAGRRGAAVEARPARPRAPADARRPRPRPRARRARLGGADRAVDGGADRGGARRLAGVRGTFGARRPGEARRGAAPSSRSAGSPACRAPTGARRWRTPASASASSASPRSGPGRSRTSVPSAPARASPSVPTPSRSPRSSSDPRAELHRRDRHGGGDAERPRGDDASTPRSGSTRCRE